MKLLCLSSATFVLALGGCASGQRAASAWEPQRATIAVGDGTQLILSSEPGTRVEAGDRALALQAREAFCAQDREWACTAGTDVYVWISPDPDGRCGFTVGGEKHRVAAPRETMRAIARLDCEEGRLVLTRQNFLPPGAVSGGGDSSAWRADPEATAARTPITVMNAQEVLANSAGRTPD